MAFTVHHVVPLSPAQVRVYFTEALVLTAAVYERTNYAFFVRRGYGRPLRAERVTPGSGENPTWVDIDLREGMLAGGEYAVRVRGLVSAAGSLIEDGYFGQPPAHPFVSDALVISAMSSIALVPGTVDYSPDLTGVVTLQDHSTFSWQATKSVAAEAPAVAAAVVGPAVVGASRATTHVAPSLSLVSATPTISASTAAAAPIITSPVSGAFLPPAATVTVTGTWSHAFPNWQQLPLEYSINGGASYLAVYNPSVNGQTFSFAADTGGQTTIHLRVRLRVSASFAVTSPETLFYMVLVSEAPTALSTGVVYGDPIRIAGWGVVGANVYVLTSSDLLVIRPTRNFTVVVPAEGAVDGRNEWVVWAPLFESFGGDGAVVTITATQMETGKSMSAPAGSTITVHPGDPPGGGEAM